MSRSWELPLNDALFSIAPDEIEKLDTDSQRWGGIIGQPRALEALKMGTRIWQKGYNIFVTGQPGTGRKTALYQILKEHPSTGAPQKDIVLTYNFKRPDHPRPIYLDAGEARQFQKDLGEMIRNLRQQIRNKLESPGFNKIKNDIISSIKDHERRVLVNFETRLNEAGFTAVNQESDDPESIDIAFRSKEGPLPLPLLEERLARGELSEEEFLELRRRYFAMKDDLHAIFRALLRSKSQMRNEIAALRVITVTPEIHLEMESLRIDYQDPSVHKFLDDMAEDIANNLDIILSEDDHHEDSPNPGMFRYEINILKENRQSHQTAPIVFEGYPTYKNLFGFVDSPHSSAREPRGTHLDVVGGAFLQASGGYLVINAEDLVKEEQAFKYLKRTLETGTVTILPEEALFSGPRKNLIPEDIDVNVKVVLMGNENLYEMLFNRDPEFSRHFKVSADFDSTMPRTRETMGKYIHFIEAQCPLKDLRPLDLGGKAEVIRFGTQLAEDRSRLSPCFAEVLDLLVEADYWAREEKNPVITAPIIRRALKKRRYMASLAEEKINEMIANGDIHIPLREPQVGQINALAIHERGFFSFGTPCLISAKTSPGDSGIINIEGEVGLSGEIHDKWVYILEGYLRHHYTPRFPLTLYATLCFEQSYGEIDGDSASVAEMCALLSSIAGIPLRQTIAVTGSLSQTGQVQPVGGITEKVEGFFGICAMQELTGEHGVIIPRQNIKNLILPEEIEAALRDRRFHLYPVDTLNDVLEILSGLPAGIRGPKGAYPPDSFNYHVEKRLRQLHALVKRSDD